MSLEINAIYKGMLAEQKKQQLAEAVTSSNSIHSDVETMMNDFSTNIKSEINVEEIEEKLTNLEKNELTSLDKKIITQIRKIVTALGKPMDDFENFKKNLKFEYVVTKKGGDKKDETEEAPTDEEAPIDELPDTEMSPDEEPIPTDEYTEQPERRNESLLREFFKFDIDGAKVSVSDDEEDFVIEKGTGKNSEKFLVKGKTSGKKFSSFDTKPEATSFIKKLKKGVKDCCKKKTCKESTQFSFQNILKELQGE